MVWEETSCMILAVICLAMTTLISDAFRMLSGKSGWVISPKLLSRAVYGYTDLSAQGEISVNFSISAGNANTSFRIRFREVK